MIPYASKRFWVKGLQYQRANATDHHRNKICMHLPCDRLWTKQTPITYRFKKCYRRTATSDHFSN